MTEAGPAPQTWTAADNSSTPQLNGEDAGSLAEVCAELYERVEEFLAEQTDDELLKKVQERARTSLGVISEAMERYRIQNISLSYNGGKDCLVLLVLFLSALHTKLQSMTTTPTTVTNSHKTDRVESHKITSVQSIPTAIPAIYCPYFSSFPQVESFVSSSSAQYHLNLTRYATSPSFGLKAAFSAYLEANKDVKLIFVGTRRTDPHGEFLTHFDETDHGWPRFMRCHPVIDWRYKEIWAFIRHLKIPYCSLYDEGYTSLGGTLDTHPNPALLRETVEEGPDSPVDRPKPSFRPAYELMADDEERLGRD